MQFHLEEVVAHLRKVRSEYGAESFHQSLKGLFRDLIGKPGSEQYIQRLLAEFDVDPAHLASIEAEAKAAASARSREQPSADVLRLAIGQEMPNCKTQAQFDLVIESWNALRVYLNAVYGFDRETSTKARAGLDQLLELAPQVAVLHERLESSPEATTNRDYLDEPKQLTERHKQQKLLAELGAIENLEQLQAWYGQAKPLLDSIVSQSLRDGLFDAIREKKHAFTN